MDININDLDKLKLDELREIGKNLSIKSLSSYRKNELVEIIKEAYSNSKNFENNESSSNDLDDSNENFDLGEKFNCEGLLDLHEDGFGFLRTELYESSNDDIYVSPKQVKMFRLKTGDFIKGIARVKKDKDKFSPLIFVSDVNGLKAADAFNRSNFESLTPIYPNQKLKLETSKDKISQRIIDIIAPIGRGQRGLIVSQPKAGKTTLIKDIEYALEKNFDCIFQQLVLIDCILLKLF